MAVSKNQLYPCFGYNYLNFGRLVEWGDDGSDIWIKNEEGHKRYKSKKYTSWPTTVDKIEGMVGQKVITRTSYDNAEKANIWFSDIFVNETFTGNLYDEDGSKVKSVSHNLLAVPTIEDKKRAGLQKTVRELLIHARIQTQQQVYWAKRRMAWDYADVEETNQLLQEENALLSKKDKDDLANQAQLVKEALPQWLETDTLPTFRIVAGARQDSGGMTHVDVDFARRLRIDTTSRARVEADVLDYLGGNFIKVRLNLRNMDKPVVCGLGVMKLHHENTWQIKTVRPIYDNPKRTKTHYRLERAILGDTKGNQTTVDDCFAVYDEVSKQMPKDD